MTDSFRDRNARPPSMDSGDSSWYGKQILLGGLLHLCPSQPLGRCDLLSGGGWHRSSLGCGSSALCVLARSLHFGPSRSLSGCDPRFARRGNLAAYSTLLTIHSAERRKCRGYPLELIRQPIPLFLQCLHNITHVRHLFEAPRRDSISAIPRQ
jgi:hypothetical protein